MCWILSITRILIGKETAGIQLRIFLQNWRENKFAFLSLFSLIEFRCFSFNEFVVHIFKYIHTYIMQKKKKTSATKFLEGLIETEKKLDFECHNYHNEGFYTSI